MEIVDRVNELMAKYLEEKGIELVEMTYKRESGGMTLRLLVDTAEGVTIDECEKLNIFLSETLDRENVIDERYVIDVSSPGLDRPIVTDKDFTRAMGKVLDISTYEPIDAKKNHYGKLIGMEKDNVVIESNGVSVVIPKSKIARAKLKIEF